MEEIKNRYFIINKPYKMVSQFISPDNVNLLGDIKFDWPEGTHAIGRLDNNSEGLLILTTNKRVTKLLFESDKPHKRTYVVHCERVMSTETLEKIKTGISIRIKGGGYYTTTACEAEIIEKPTYLQKRAHEFREDLPHTWIKLTLTEGKYHQIRKMVSEVRHHCKRLVRISIEDLELSDLEPGGVREIEEVDFFEKLKIDNWS